MDENCKTCQSGELYKELKYAIPAEQAITSMDCCCPLQNRGSVFLRAENSKSCWIPG